MNLVDQGSETDEFWTLLGCAGGTAIAEATSDEAVANETSKLYRVSDASGALSIEEVASEPLRRDMLDESDVFIVDSGSELFVWVRPCVQRLF